MTMLWQGLIVGRFIVIWPFVKLLMSQIFVFRVLLPKSILLDPYFLGLTLSTHFTTHLFSSLTIQTLIITDSFHLIS